MVDLYTAAILITMLFLLITIADISTNRLVTKATKVRSVITSLLIAGFALGECVGVLTNGAAASLLIPHKIAKAVEFSMAPAIGVAAAIAYGDPKKPKLAIALAAAHVSLNGSVYILNGFSAWMPGTSITVRDSTGSTWSCLSCLLFIASSALSAVEKRIRSELTVFSF